MWLKFNNGLVNLATANVLSVIQSQGGWDLMARGLSFGDMPLATAPTEGAAMDMLREIEDALLQGQALHELPQEYANPTLLR